jgi:transcriptional antiterminator RfaH
MNWRGIGAELAQSATASEGAAVGADGMGVAMGVDMVTGDGVTVTAIAPGAGHPECGASSETSPLFKPATKRGGARPGSGPKRKAVDAVGEAMPKHQGLRWYCVQAKPRSELLAIIQLTARGFQTFLPLHQPDRQQVLRPLFPGWLFVQFDQAAGLWGGITRAPGVQELYPASPLDPALIGELIRLYGPGGAGVLPERAASLEPMQRGQMVRVIDGMMFDLVGVCQWSDRQKVELLAEIMGRQVRVNVPRRAVEEA